MTKLLVIIDWRIRGVTRNPAKYEEDPQYQDVELVAANLDDQTSLEKAFEGANAIYAVTDFWQWLKQDATFQQAEKQSKKPNEIAMEREIQHGKNIVQAAANQVSTLDRLVLSTLSDSNKWSNGEIRWNLHFDGKGRYEAYLKQQFSELAKKTSYLHVGYYLSNWKMNPSFAPQKEEDGNFVIRKFGLPNGKPIPFVNPPNDTGHFVRALILSPSAPPGSSMLGYCELTTSEEYCAIWGRVHGVQCRAEVLTYEDALAQGMPDWMALEISESGTYVTKFGWAGGDPDVKHPKDLGVDVSKLTMIEDWIRQEDWSSVF
ncbi:hypothetical protein LTR37_006150 [Vermiconidia calcicola]|uniref:Uncharacterized protein n=1 Tax=Vermiconidia calcicola TaxID=1690605 RepID=A0ACC3NIP7_9PEZI|nr:hypothetical protein LTR37_006150 [Vermiconidia calcicola]